MIEETERISRRRCLERGIGKSGMENWGRRGEEKREVYINIKRCVREREKEGEKWEMQSRNRRRERVELVLKKSGNN